MLHAKAERPPIIKKYAKTKSSSFYLIQALFLNSGSRIPWLARESPAVQKEIWDYISLGGDSYLHGETDEFDDFLDFLVQFANTKYIQLRWNVMKYVALLKSNITLLHHVNDDNYLEWVKYLINAFQTNETILLALFSFYNDIDLLAAGPQSEYQRASINLVIAPLCDVLLEPAESSGPEYQRVVNVLQENTLKSDIDSKEFEFTKLDRLLIRHGQVDAPWILKTLENVNMYIDRSSQSQKTLACLSKLANLVQMRLGPTSFFMQRIVPSTPSQSFM